MKLPHLACLALGLAAAACFGTPTPLAPGLAGSVGAPQAGVQTDAAELPVRGPGFIRYRQRSAHYWGHPRLVGAIQRAAARVREELPGGAALTVGDLSARSGGPIPGHRSHRSGRDVDLLLFVTTPSGAPVPSPGFVHMGADGLARIDPGHDYVRLDVERQWLLVKALLEDDQALPVWMFASRDIEALLVDYARARGESPDLIVRAETVLLQPGDSTPHDDHIHLRIACAPEDAIAGCLGGGPYWEWLPPWPRLAPDESLAAARWIADDDPLGAGDALEVGE